MKLANVLSDEEKFDLRTLEATIESGLSHFIAVGSALLEISDKKLYRETHSNFKLYCLEKWKMGDRRAYQLIDAAKVVKEVSEKTSVNHGSQIKTERQARELGKAPKSKQVDALLEAKKEAEKNGEKLTSKHIKKAVVKVISNDRRFSRQNSSRLSSSKPLPRGGLCADAIRDLIKGETANGFEERSSIETVHYTTTLQNPVFADPLAEARARVQACYELNKTKWNSLPTPPPMAIIDAIMEALK